MPNATHTTDVAIIGAGPVGLFAIFECGMLGMRCQVIDVLDAIGGQCIALYPEKPIYDIPAYPKVMAADLVDRLVAQAAPFEPVYHLGERADTLEGLGERGWRLTTSKGTVIEARAVIIAAGVGAFEPNRPPLPGIEAYEDSSVFYLVKRRDDFRGKRIVIAGGGGSAVDWALSLSEVAERVFAVHRRPKFRAAPKSVARLHELAEGGNVDLVIPYQLHRLDGADGRLSAVIVKTLEGEERRIEADVLLPFFGLSTKLGPIAEWSLDLDRNLILIDPATCETNARGVFAIGDIAAYPGKLKLILTGFSEAAMAAHAVHPLVFPGEALHFEYSTTKGLPGGG